MKRFTVACVLLIAPAVSWAERADWIYPVTYRGKPVVGAKVGLVLFTSPTLGEWKAGEPILTTTDESGEARFPEPATLPSRSSARVLARDAAGHGGYGSLYGDDRRYPSTIELLDNTELTGRVTDAGGKPISGLTLKPVAVGPERRALVSGPLRQKKGTRLFSV